MRNTMMRNRSGNRWRRSCWNFGLELTAAALCLFTLGTTVAEAQDWQEFRGTAGRGIATANGLPLEFGPGDARWRIDLPGKGWSSPVLAGNQIWMTTAIRAADGSASGLALAALCVDRESGKLLHQVELFRVPQPPEIHSLNSYASPTPVIEGETVYCNFGTMGTAAIQRSTGRVLWRNDELKFEHETGPGSSPIVHGDLLIVHCDGTDQQFVTAFRKSDGTIAWRTPRSGELHPEGMMKKAFSTPLIVEGEDGPQLISPGANWVYGYDPATGRELWKVSYGKLGFSNVPRPLQGNGLLYVCTGFNQASLVALRFDGKRTLSESDIAWRFEKQVPTMPTPILVEQLLFMVSDKGVATCLDAVTGKQQWQKRLGGEFSASPILADGRLYFCNHAGQVFVLAPKAEFELLATNELPDGIMATPAAVGNQLIFRTKTGLLRIDGR
ncbi:MAG: PQQ-binding-like beta-propeller repeat protein [Planctomycetota bacterium]|jgi:outer membrane protein assembly factor BamB